MSHLGVQRITIDLALDTLVHCTVLWLLEVQDLPVVRWSKNRVEIWKLPSLMLATTTFCLKTSE